MITEKKYFRSRGKQEQMHTDQNTLKIFSYVTRSRLMKTKPKQKTWIQYIKAEASYMSTTYYRENVKP